MDPALSPGLLGATHPTCSEGLIVLVCSWLKPAIGDAPILASYLIQEAAPSEHKHAPWGKPCSNTLAVVFFSRWSRCLVPCRVHAMKGWADRRDPSRLRSNSDANYRSCLESVSHHDGALRIVPCTGHELYQVAIITPRHAITPFRRREVKAGGYLGVGESVASRCRRQCVSIGWDCTVTALLTLLLPPRFAAHHCENHHQRRAD